MKANFEAELRGGDSYVAKLEENMLKNAFEAAADENLEKEVSPEIIDGQAVP